MEVEYCGREELMAMRNVAVVLGGLTRDFFSICKITRGIETYGLSDAAVDTLEVVLDDIKYLLGVSIINEIQEVQSRLSGTGEVGDGETFLYFETPTRVPYLWLAIGYRNIPLESTWIVDYLNVCLFSPY
jgi:hypothetical protein